MRMRVFWAAACVCMCECAFVCACVLVYMWVGGSACVEVSPVDGAGAAQWEVRAAVEAAGDDPYNDDESVLTGPGPTEGARAPSHSQRIRVLTLAARALIDADAVVWKRQNRAKLRLPAAAAVAGGGAAPCELIASLWTRAEPPVPLSSWHVRIC
jgi:hypothetical protein